MRVRALLALGVAAILVGSAAACKGGSDSSSSELLGARDFTNKVAAAIVTGSDLQAEPIFGLKVGVSEPNGLDALQIVLEDAFRRYRAAPERRQQIIGGLVREAVTQMRDGNANRGFAAVRDHLMPLLQRKTVVAGSSDSPAITRFDDLDVVYGVQEERSFMVVSEDDVARWGRSLGEIHRLATANLERETNKDEKLLCEPSGGQKLCGWASGDGYDATRMLVPGLRRQIVHELGAPAVYAVPLESVFVALTRNYAKVIKGKVLQEFTTGKNPVSPELFVERNGRLVALPQ
jgi:uncharacterized protein YtpQ (UPF0354 family)